MEDRHWRHRVLRVSKKACHTSKHNEKRHRTQHEITDRVARLVLLKWPPTLINLEVSWVMKVPPVIIQILDWDSPWKKPPSYGDIPMTSWKPPICLRWLHPVNWWNPPVLEICLRSFGASAAMYCTVFRSVVFLVGIRRGEKHWKTDQTKRHGHLEECESVCINIQCISMYFPHW